LTFILFFSILTVVKGEKLKIITLSIIISALVNDDFLEGQTVIHELSFQDGVVDIKGSRGGADENFTRKIILSDPCEDGEIEAQGVSTIEGREPIVKVIVEEVAENENVRNAESVLETKGEPIVDKDIKTETTSEA